MQELLLKHVHVWSHFSIFCLFFVFLFDSKALKSKISPCSYDTINKCINSRKVTFTVTSRLGKLISFFYLVLLDIKTDKSDHTTTFTEVDRESWQEFKASYMFNLISAIDMNIQLKMFHQIYFTPVKLYSLGLHAYQSCFKDCQEEAYFF